MVIAFIFIAMLWECNIETTKQIKEYEKFNKKKNGN